jgi:hypothetical protein
MAIDGRAHGKFTARYPGPSEALCGLIKIFLSTN